MPLRLGRVVEQISPPCAACAPRAPPRRVPDAPTEVRIGEVDDLLALDERGDDGAGAPALHPEQVGNLPEGNPLVLVGQEVEEMLLLRP